MSRSELRGRIVGRYPHGQPDALTVLDVTIARRYFKVAVAVYHRTRITPGVQARTVLVVGAIVMGVSSIATYGTTADGYLTLAINLALIETVHHEVRRMTRVHRQIEHDDGRLTAATIRAMFRARRMRLMCVELGLLDCGYSCAQFARGDFGAIETVFCWLVFILYPLYVCCLADPPTASIRDRASAAARRRLAELTQAIRPRPAIGGAPA